MQSLNSFFFYLIPYCMFYVLGDYLEVVNKILTRCMVILQAAPERHCWCVRLMLSNQLPGTDMVKYIILFITYIMFGKWSNMILIFAIWFACKPNPYMLLIRVYRRCQTHLSYYHSYKIKILHLHIARGVECLNDLWLQLATNHLHPYFKGRPPHGAERGYSLVH